MTTTTESERHAPSCNCALSVEEILENATADFEVASKIESEKRALWEAAKQANANKKPFTMEGRQVVDSAHRVWAHADHAKTVAFKKFQTATDNAPNKFDVARTAQIEKDTKNRDYIFVAVVVSQIEEELAHAEYHAPPAIKRRLQIAKDNLAEYIKKHGKP